MARINLLPWRETQRKERERQFYLLLGLAASLTLFIGFYVHMHIGGLVNKQEARNQFLTQNIAKLDQEIQTIRSLEVEKTRLLNRMGIIQQLQTSRPEVVHLFEELVNTLPDGMHLLKVTQEGPELQIEGVAESNARISSFMRNMDASAWLTNPELIVINSNKPEFPNSSWFSLKVRKARPGMPEQKP